MQVHVQSAPGLTVRCLNPAYAILICEQVPDDEQLDAKFKAMEERFWALPARTKVSA